MRYTGEYEPVGQYIDKLGKWIPLPVGHRVVVTGNIEFGDLLWYDLDGTWNSVAELWVNNSVAIYIAAARPIRHNVVTIE